MRMQFLSIDKNMKLSELSEIVGASNVESVLHLNSLSRTPNVGKTLNRLCDNIVSTTAKVSSERKIAILNGLTEDADIFEKAALMDD